MSQNDKMKTFTASFGLGMNQAAPVRSDFHNFQKDRQPSAINDKWGNFAKGGESFLYLGVNLNKTYEDLTFKWWLNNVLVSESQDPTLEEIDNGFWGYFWMECEVREVKFGTVSKKGRWVYIQYNWNSEYMPLEDIYIPEGEAIPTSLWNLGGGTNNTPIFEHDYNGDGIVTVQDLTAFLSSLKQQ